LADKVIQCSFFGKDCCSEILNKLLILNQTSIKQIELRLDDSEITDSVEVANAFN